MGGVSLLLVLMLCTVMQQSSLSPAAGGSPTEGVYVVIGPLGRKSLMQKSSPREAPVEGSDYALFFAKKASNVNLLMEKGADVKFEGDVDNINAEYVSSGSSGVAVFEKPEEFQLSNNKLLGEIE